MGPLLASFPCVTHCYERLPVQGRWEYTIYTVHHGYSRDAVLAEIRTLADHIGVHDYVVLFRYPRSSNAFRMSVSGRMGVSTTMNRITQCMHGKGTVSGVMRHRHESLTEVPSKYLAFSGMYRPVVFWNLTDRCNLSCAHCYNRSGPGCQTEGELSTAEALGLIDDLAEMGIPLILFTGGEPLMREDIWELARACQKERNQNGTQHERDPHYDRYCPQDTRKAGSNMPGSRLTVHGQRLMTGSGIPRVLLNGQWQHSPRAGRLGSGAVSG